MIQLRDSSDFLFYLIVLFVCFFSRRSPSKHSRSSPQHQPTDSFSSIEEESDDIGMEIDDSLISIQETPLEGAAAYAEAEDEAQYRYYSECIPAKSNIKSYIHVVVIFCYILK